jgi:hypothetical protein
MVFPQTASWPQAVAAFQAQPGSVVWMACATMAAQLWNVPTSRLANRSNGSHQSMHVQCTAAAGSSGPSSSGVRPCSDNNSSHTSVALQRKLSSIALEHALGHSGTRLGRRQAASAAVLACLAYLPDPQGASTPGQSHGAHASGHRYLMPTLACVIPGRRSSPWPQPAQRPQLTPTPSLSAPQPVCPAVPTAAPATCSGSGGCRTGRAQLILGPRGLAV